MNKEVSVPALASALVAVISLLFYSTLVQTSSVHLSANFISIVSLVSIIQIFFIPQAWIFVFGAHDNVERRKRITSSYILEITGFIIGFIFLLPIAIYNSNSIAIILAYSALSMAGSTASQGYLRGEGRWSFYVTFIILPSLIRLSLAVTSSLLGINLSESIYDMVFYYLLLPESIRYFFINVPIIYNTWTSPQSAQIKSSFSHLFRNWIYDIGSAITEVSDKYLLSLIVSPTLLIIYFFVRKISTAITLVLEPFYSSRYRKILISAVDHHLAISLRSTLISGYAIALLITIFTLAVINVTKIINISSLTLVPDIVIGNMSIFAPFLFIDSMIAANRWGRYVTLISGHSKRLLLVRIFCFIIFVATTAMLSPSLDQLALLIGFMLYGTLEMAYIIQRTTSIRSSHG